jgi:hypothetical protein
MFGDITQKSYACNDDERLDADLSLIDKLVAAFVRIRDVNRLDGAVISRYWLACDMGVIDEDLDCLLKLLEWQGMIELPNQHWVTVRYAGALQEIALARSGCAAEALPNRYYC